MTPIDSWMSTRHRESSPPTAARRPDRRGAAPGAGTRPARSAASGARDRDTGPGAGPLRPARRTAGPSAGPGRDGPRRCSQRDRLPTPRSIEGPARFAGAVGAAVHGHRIGGVGQQAQQAHERRERRVGLRRGAQVDPQQRDARGTRLRRERHGGCGPEPPRRHGIRHEHPFRLDAVQQRRRRARFRRHQRNLHERIAADVREVTHRQVRVGAVWCSTTTRSGVRPTAPQPLPHRAASVTSTKRVRRSRSTGTAAFADGPVPTTTTVCPASRLSVPVSRAEFDKRHHSGSAAVSQYPPKRELVAATRGRRAAGRGHRPRSRLASGGGRSRRPG